ncbi:hypothetical protein HaLaN_01243, partial [Haematococcus lacustris]
VGSNPSRPPSACCRARVQLRCSPLLLSWRGCWTRALDGRSRGVLKPIFASSARVVMGQTSCTALEIHGSAQRKLD